MFDPTQTLLVAVITTLTILLTIIGIQVLQILKELKETLGKVNKILDESDKIVTSVSEPMMEASEFVRGLKKGANVLNLLSRFFMHKNKGKKTKNEWKEAELLFTQQK